ncbi:SusC/RagA family TonB-linked outer membrane protein, partial [Parabacteroides sp.]
MKLTFLFLVISLLTFTAEASAQRVSMSLNNVKVEKVLSAITKQTGLSVAYSKQIVNLDRKVSIQVENADVASVLEKLVADTNLNYEIKNNKIYLFEKQTVTTKPAIQQQKKQISGKIVDQNGEFVIGANVVVAGTAIGTITDTDGNFTLEVPNGATLKISYIGYIEQSIPIGNKSVISVILKEDSQTLNEVVVVGYGTQKKATLTGAVASVRSEQIANRAASDATNLLTGIAPGLTAIQRSGQPGADGAEFIIRGPGTLNSTSPLIIVDGIPGSMNAIDPNDIESISVLKDAASAAIYGVRAGNGVILVTTKKGKEGRMKVSYNGYIGFQNPTRLPKWVNSTDYATLYNEALTNDGLAPKYSDTDIENYRKGTDPDLYPNSNQTDELFSKSGFQHSHHVQLDGGTEKTRYNFSLGYLNREGLIAQTGLERYSIRGNFDFDISKRVNFGMNFSYIRQEKSQPYQSINELVHRSYRETPVTPIKWSNGNWAAFMNEHNSVAEAQDGGYDHYTDNFLT